MEQFVLQPQGWKLLERPQDPAKVFDAELFTFLLNLEVCKATRLQYCISVLFLTADLPYEDGSSTLPDRLAELAIRQLRTGDLAARFPPSSVALLLIDAETRALPLIYERVKAALQIDPLAVRERMSGLTLSAGAACYPHTASSGSELLEQAADLMNRARKDGGNRLHLPPRFLALIPVIPVVAAL